MSATLRVVEEDDLTRNYTKQLARRISQNICALVSLTHPRRLSHEGITNEGTESWDRFKPASVSLNSSDKVKLAQRCHCHTQAPKAHPNSLHAIIRVDEQSCHSKNRKEAPGFGTF